jgi:hypothetical protein
MPLGLTVADLPQAVRLRRERIDSILVGQEQFAATEITVTDPLDGKNRGLTAIRATAASQRWRSGRAQRNRTSRPMDDGAVGKATAFAGSVVLITIIGAFVVEIARGQDGLPYSWLGALGGVSYIGAVVALRIRS